MAKLTEKSTEYYYSKSKDTNDWLLFRSLIYAIMNQDVKTVQLLIEMGVDVNQDYGAGFPLDFAISTRNLTLCEMLVNAGASVNNVDEMGRTPLVEAVLSGSYCIVNLVLSKGVNITDALVEELGSLFSEGYTEMEFGFRSME